MQDIFIISVFFSLIIANLIGMYMGKLFLSVGVFLPRAERKTGKAAVAWGTLQIIILLFVLYFSSSLDQLNLDIKNTIYGLIISIVVSPFLYTYYHIIEEKK
jgi:hypothetical protein